MATQIPESSGEKSIGLGGAGKHEDDSKLNIDFKDKSGNYIDSKSQAADNGGKNGWMFGDKPMTNPDGSKYTEPQAQGAGQTAPSQSATASSPSPSTNGGAQEAGKNAPAPATSAPANSPTASQPVADHGTAASPQAGSSSQSPSGVSAGASPATSPVSGQTAPAASAASQAPNVGGVASQPPVQFGQTIPTPSSTGAAAQAPHASQSPAVGTGHVTPPVDKTTPTRADNRNSNNNANGAHNITNDKVTINNAKAGELMANLTKQGNSLGSHDLGNPQMDNGSPVLNGGVSSSQSRAV